MLNHRQSRLVLAILVVCAFAIAGCGGDDKKAGGSEAKPQSKAEIKAAFNEAADEFLNGANSSKSAATSFSRCLTLTTGQESCLIAANLTYGIARTGYVRGLESILETLDAGECKDSVKAAKKSFDDTRESTTALADAAEGSRSGNVADTTKMFESSTEVSEGFTAAVNELNDAREVCGV